MKVAVMTKLITRKPHPARRARIAAATISSTAFLTIISSFAWNTHIAELAASSTPVTPEAPVAPAATATSPGNAAVPADPAAAVGTAPAATVAAATPAKKKVKAATATTPAAPATVPTTTPVAAPTTPVVTPTVAYTCISDGSHPPRKTSNFDVYKAAKTQQQCSLVAQYGYHWVKV